MVSEADIVVVTKQQTGEPELHLSTQTAAENRPEPCWWGAIISLLLARPIGMAQADGDGLTSRQLPSHGIDSRFIRRVAARFRTAAAMLFVLTPDIAFDMVLNDLKSCRARCEILAAALSRQDEEGLKHALSGA